MTVSHQEVVSNHGVASDARQRTPRHGHLAPQLGAPAATQIRAACQRCGTHLLAVPHADGSLEGTCPVCLSLRVERVGGHHATA